MIFTLSILPAHSQVNLDSLWSVWLDETASDSCRADAMKLISWNGYLYSQPDSAFYFAQLLYDFSKERDMKGQMARALNTQGVSWYVRSDYIKAMDYYQRSLRITEKMGDKRRMASVLNNIGLIYSRTGYNPKALQYYQRSLRIYEDIHDSSRIAAMLNNIGVICVDQGDYPMAMEYFQQCLDISEQIEDNRRVAVALNNLGLGYTDREEYDKAMDHYQRSLEINIEISNKRGMASVLEHIGHMYLAKGEYHNAIDYLQRGMAISKELSDERSVVGALNYIGIINNKIGDYSKAIEWCGNGLQKAQAINTLEEQRDACQCLYDAYKALQNNSMALVYHEQAVALNDSLEEEKTAIKLQQLEFARQVMKDSLVREEEKLRVQLVHEAEVRKKSRVRNIFILVALFLLMAAVGLYRRIVIVRRSRAAIEKAKQMSDKLLLNILPSEIAEELKKKGKADARKFEQVSILFTDFKNFTQTSEKLTAEELVGEINTCFKTFDTISIKYGIEKIKTIGDSYMVAGGLPVPSADAVKNTVLAGLEMAAYITRRKSKQTGDDGCFEMRVGIHTGPVVAGIVGVTKFQYDIWGDAVNIAARMESSGEVGQVNISRSTYELIRDDPAFRFQPRGKVKVKGKDDIEMWFVERAE
jgi:class 3 adenylate cyclase/Tfp pilus assembly protein PilF